MTDTAAKTADDMVSEADTGARDAGPSVAKLIFWISILWSLFQLYIASRVPGMVAEITGVNIFANIVAQARFVHLAFALTLATLAFPMFGDRHRVPWYDWLLIAGGIAATLYLVAFRFQIADRPGLWTSTDLILSGIGMLVLMIAVYRSLGLPLVVIASLFLGLAFFGGYSEWVGSITNYGGASFSKFKEALAELATVKLTPIGEEMRRLMADPVEIDRILSDGARRAHDIADPILAKTKDIVGFIRS